MKKVIGLVFACAPAVQAVCAEPSGAVVGSSIGSAAGVAAVGPVARTVRAAGYVYQAGSSRVVLSANARGWDRGASARAAFLSSRVEIWQHDEPLFDPRATGHCRAAIGLPGLVLSEGSDGAPSYEAHEATAQFDPDTVVDAIQVGVSAIDEPAATRGNGVDDPVPFNDLVIVFEEGENAVQEIGSSPFQVVLGVTDLLGDDTPDAPGAAVFQYTIDLAGFGFETGDTNGVLELPGAAAGFAPFSFNDAGITAGPSPDAVDGLHDASYMVYLLQPDGQGGQIDPQDPAQLALVQSQGVLTGIGAGWAEDPFPAIANQEQGSARGSFDLIRRWDLTLPGANGGVDLSDPAGGFVEGTPGDLGGAQRLCDGIVVPPWVIDLVGFPCRIRCEDVVLENPDNPGEFFTLPVEPGSEPYIGFFGPVSDLGCPIRSRTAARLGNDADIAELFGILDQSDIDLFIQAFQLGDVCADVAPPRGVFDLADVDLFIGLFLGGRP